MSEKKVTSAMGTAPLFRLLLSMGIPGLLGTMTTYLYKAADQIFVGNLVGRNALGGISVLSPFDNVVVALSLFITVGGAAVLAVALGSKDYERANTLFTNVIVQAVLMASVVMAIFSLFPKQFVSMFGAKEGTEVYDYAVRYLRIVSLGQMFNMLNLGLAALIRTEGNTKYSMFANVIGAFVNILLNALFMMVFKMGIEGAALGTIMSQLIGACVSAAYFISGKSNLKWIGFKVVNVKLMVYVAKMGIAPSIFQILSFITNIMLNKSLQHYGDIDPVYALIGGGELCISAMATVTTVERLIISVGSGLNQAASPIISYNYGAKKYSRVWKATLLAQAMTLTVSLIIWILMMTIPDTLVSIFSKGDTELVTFGIEAMRISKMFALFSGYQMLVSMFFSATCRPEVATLVSLSRHGIFLIPALYILPRIFGLQGVLIANAVSDGCSMILVSILYFSEIRRLRKVSDGEFYDDTSFIKRFFSKKHKAIENV